MGELSSQSENSSRRQRSEAQVPQQEKTDSDETVELESVQVDLRRAIIGGVLAGVVALLGGWFVGETSGAEARLLLETSLTTTRSFAGTVTLALGNILALMLTLLSLSTSTEVQLKWSHYQRVKEIARLVSIVLTASILIYLLLNVPLSESDKASSATGFGYGTLYYVSLVLSSMMAGALITVVLMLYNTLHDIIHVIGSRDPDHPLVYSEEDESS